MFFGSIYTANTIHLRHQRKLSENNRDYKYLDTNTLYLTDQKECNTTPAPCLRRNFHYGEIHINSLGFKGREISVKKDADVFRTVCLGASTTFGQMDAKESFDYPSDLETLLSKYADYSYKKTKFEVINASICGVTSSVILEKFKQNIVDLSPDLAIYGPEWNDVWSGSIISPEQNAIMRNYFLGLANDKEVIALGPWFSRHIDEFRERKQDRLKWYIKTLKDVKLSVMQELSILTFPDFDKLKRTLKFEDYEMACRRNPKKYPIGQQSPLDDFEPEYFRKNITGLIEYARMHNIQVGLATTPDDFDDYIRPINIYNTNYIIFELNDWAAYNRNVLNPEIRRLAKENNLILIDLEKEFNKLKDKKPYFVQEFMHISKEGNLLIAYIYAKTLQHYVKDMP